jgi:hypothetical protein
MACSRGKTRSLKLVATLLVLLLARAAQGGGPLYVAGVSSFNSGTKGTPLTWPLGVVTYYTDRGDLSPLLPGPTADAFVADAFTRWTTIVTAAVSAPRAGQLAEDVNGTNVIANGNGVSLPTDILPSATSFPLAVVYDGDGAVIDALVGQGASDASLCASNSVLGGPDNLSRDAHLAHALVILNGKCAQTPAQLPDLKYHLVRTLGRVLGLDWSQLNLNVLSGNPRPTAADYAGFPVMHAVDPAACVPIAKCYPAGFDPTQPSLDDRAALSRLYPVTAQNAASFPGKQVFSDHTVRIHGSVFFVDANGQPAQPMQGVNVVARWVDPATGASRTYSISSVSGFLFRGNAGNPITGFNDASGQRFDRFGSDDTAVEGFFDLAGLTIPSGPTPAEFELSVENMDPAWSYGMGPYGPWPVQAAGNVRVFVNAGLGDDIEQDLVMNGSAVVSPNSFGATSYATPAPVPASGDWMGRLSPYGDADFFSFSARANRTLSVALTALDESEAVTENKARPVIGMWSMATPETSPASVNTPSAFNTFLSGETRLDAVLNASTSFRIGISDIRGDGRPDFRYHARVLYGDSVAPARASVSGGTPLLIRGLGFGPADAVSIGTATVPLLAMSADQLLVTAPAAKDGIQDVVLSDPGIGGQSRMSAALTYGAAPSDLLKLIAGGSQAAPVGGMAPSPVVVQAVTFDGVTPAAGASLFFTSSPAASLSACGGGASCTVLTDDSGRASTYVTVLAPAPTTITAQLAPASYNPPQQVQAIISGSETTLDIALAPQFAWIAQGATLNLPLTARALASGVPLAGQTINFQVLKGTASPGFASATTDTSGTATSSLRLSSVSQGLLVSACVQNQPVDHPCLNLQINVVPLASLRLQPVAGALQIAAAGQSFQPLTVRVTDIATPPHPVLGATVNFQSLVARAPQGSPALWIGDTSIRNHPMPVILASSVATVLSDVNGLATFQPTAGGVPGAVIVLGNVSAGIATMPFTLQSFETSSVTASASAAERSNLRKDGAAK